MYLRGKKLQLYKLSLNLSKFQRDVVIGSILGDGNLRIPGRNKEANFISDHSVMQNDYVFWKYNHLREFVLTEPKIVMRIYHKDRRRTTESIRFLTVSHPEFTDLYRTFYRNQEKIIPENIHELVNSPLILAVWIMDDGSKNHEAMFLNTQQFTVNQQMLLQECLFTNFGLETTLNKHWFYKGKQLYRIRFTTHATRKLHALVKNWIIPTMRYKFPLYPVTTLQTKDSLHHDCLTNHDTPAPSFCVFTRREGGRYSLCFW